MVRDFLNVRKQLHIRNVQFGKNIFKLSSIIVSSLLWIDYGSEFKFCLQEVNFSHSFTVKVTGNYNFGFLSMKYLL